MPEMLVTPPNGFDLGRTTRALGVGRTDRSGTWWWATTMTGSPVAMAVDALGEDVRVQWWGADEVPIAPERLLGLDDDPDATPGSPELRRRMRGLHLGSTGDVHAGLVKAVLGQMVTTTEANENARRLQSMFGRRVTAPVDGLMTTPDAETIASLTYQDLHRAGIERRRADILIEVSRRSKRLSEILAFDREGAYRRLTAVRGIGPWSAAMVMGIAWGDRDAVMVGDFHLPNMVSWALAGEDRGTDERMLELLEPYRPYRRRVLIGLKQSGVHAPRYGPRTPVRRHL